ncbi:hypothetical protein [Mycoplasma sp. SG1]|uniref:hypothetical protein n=1 Tax=Mycoplasma sp. SG1 TaxID=2810348 RepID=UPI00202495C2|nr:hypothetical protein [Mycoplasma sp. SG1]URM53052.1 hypothetical protein JRW51_01760 [Mycoplasma sp. SG1]
MKKKGLIFLILDLFISQLQDVKTIVHSNINDSFTSDEMDLFDNSISETLKMIKEMHKKINLSSAKDELSGSDDDEITESDINKFKNLFINNIQNTNLKNSFNSHHKNFTSFLNNDSTLNDSSPLENVKDIIFHPPHTKNPPVLNDVSKDEPKIIPNIISRDVYNDITNSKSVQSKFLDIFFIHVLNGKIDSGKFLFKNDDGKQKFLKIEELFINNKNNILEKPDDTEQFKVFAAEIEKNKTNVDINARANLLYNHIANTLKTAASGDKKAGRYIFYFFNTLAAIVQKTDDKEIFNIRINAKIESIKEQIKKYKQLIDVLNQLPSNKKLKKYISTLKENPSGAYKGTIKIFFVGSDKKRLAEKFNKLLKNYGINDERNYNLIEVYELNKNEPQEYTNSNFQKIFINLSGDSEPFVPANYLTKTDIDFEQNFINLTFAQEKDIKDYFLSLMNVLMNTIKNKTNLDQLIQLISESNWENIDISELDKLINFDFLSIGIGDIKYPWFINILDILETTANSKNIKTGFITFNEILPDYHNTFKQKFFKDWLNFFVLLNLNFNDNINDSENGVFSKYFDKLINNFSRSTFTSYGYEEIKDIYDFEKVYNNLGLYNLLQKLMKAKQKFIDLYQYLKKIYNHKGARNIIFNTNISKEYVKLVEMIYSYEFFKIDWENFDNFITNSNDRTIFLDTTKTDQYIIFITNFPKIDDFEKNILNSKELENICNLSNQQPNDKNIFETIKSTIKSDIKKYNDDTIKFNFFLKEFFNLLADEEYKQLENTSIVLSNKKGSSQIKKLLNELKNELNFSTNHETLLKWNKLFSSLEHDIKIESIQKLFNDAQAGSINFLYDDIELELITKDATINSIDKDFNIVISNKLLDIYKNDRINIFLQKIYITTSFKENQNANDSDNIQNFFKTVSRNLLLFKNVLLTIPFFPKNTSTELNYLRSLFDNLQSAYLTLIQNILIYYDGDINNSDNIVFLVKQDPNTHVDKDVKKYLELIENLNNKFSGKIDLKMNDEQLDFLSKSKYLKSEINFSVLSNFSESSEIYILLRSYYKEGFINTLKYILEQFFQNKNFYGKENDPLFKIFNVNFKPTDNNYWINKNKKYWDDILDNFEQQERNEYFDFDDFIFLFFFDFNTEKNKQYFKETQSNTRWITNFLTNQSYKISDYKKNFLEGQKEYINKFIDEALSLYRNFKNEDGYLGYDYNEPNVTLNYKSINIFNFKSIQDYLAKYKDKLSKELSISYVIDSIEKLKSDFNHIKGFITEESLNKIEEINSIPRLINMLIDFNSIDSTINEVSLNKDIIKNNLQNLQSSFHKAHTDLWQWTCNRFGKDYKINDPQVIKAINDFNSEITRVKSLKGESTISKTFSDMYSHYNRLLKANVIYFDNSFDVIIAKYSKENLEKNDKYLGFWDKSFRKNIDIFLKRSGLKDSFEPKILGNFIDSNFNKSSGFGQNVKSLFENWDNHVNFVFDEYLANGTTDDAEIIYIQLLLKKGSPQTPYIYKNLMDNLISVINPNYKYIGLKKIVEILSSDETSKLLWNWQNQTRDWYVKYLKKYYFIATDDKSQSASWIFFQGLGYKSYENILKEIDNSNTYEQLKEYDIDGAHYKPFFDSEIESLTEHINLLKQKFIENTPEYIGLGYDSAKDLNFKFNFKFDPKNIINKLTSYINNHASLRKFLDKKFVYVNEFLEKLYNPKLVKQPFYVKIDPDSDVLNGFLNEQRQVFLEDFNSFYRFNLKNKRYNLFRFDNRKLDNPILDYWYIKNIIDSWWGENIEDKLLIDGQKVKGYDYLVWFYSRQEDFIQEQNKLLEIEDNAYKHFFFQKKDEIFSIEDLLPNTDSLVEKVSVFGDGSTVTLYDDYVNKGNWDPFSVLSFKRVELKKGGNKRVFFTLFDFYGYSLILEADPSVSADEFRKYLQSYTPTNFKIKGGIFYRPSLGDTRTQVFIIDTDDFFLSKTKVDFNLISRLPGKKISKRSYRLELKATVDDILKQTNINGEKLDLFFDKNKYKGVLTLPYPALLFYDKQKDAKNQESWRLNFLVIPNRYDEFKSKKQIISSKDAKIFDEASVYTIQFIYNSLDDHAIKNATLRTFNSHFYRKIAGNRIIDIATTFSKDRIVDENVISFDLLRVDPDNKTVPIQKLNKDEIRELIPGDLVVDIDKIASQFPVWAIYLVSAIGGALLGIPVLWFLQRRLRYVLSYKRSIKKIDDEVKKHLPNEKHLKEPEERTGELFTKKVKKPNYNKKPK